MDRYCFVDLIVPKTEEETRSTHASNISVLSGTIFQNSTLEVDTIHFIELLALMSKI